MATVLVKRLLKSLRRKTAVLMRFGPMLMLCLLAHTSVAVSYCSLRNSVSSCRSKANDLLKVAYNAAQTRASDGTFRKPLQKHDQFCRMIIKEPTLPESVVTGVR